MANSWEKANAFLYINLFVIFLLTLQSAKWLWQKFFSDLKLDGYKFLDPTIPDNISIDNNISSFTANPSQWEVLL